MLEIELKSKCPDIKDMEQKLRNSGFSFITCTQERDVYFNHPSRDFIKTDEALRLRQEGTTCIMTYKGPKIPGKFKTREEVETEVDFNAMLMILSKTGFSKGGDVLKTRKVYRKNDITACLDDVENLGQYIELEIISDDREYAENKLFNLAEMLGLHTFITESYLAMIKKQSAV